MAEKTILEELIETQKKELGAATLSIKELTDNFKTKELTYEQEVTALKTKLDDALTSMNRTDVNAASKTDELAGLRTKEFIDWSMRGKEYDETKYQELGPFEMKMLSSDNLRTGGHWMPSTMYNRILEEVVNVDPFRQIANVVRLTEGDRLEGLYEDGTLDAAWTTERATVTEKDTPEIDKWEIPTHPMYVYPKITQKMARLAAFDVENWLLAKYAKAFAYLENYAFLNGSGVGQPMGIMTVAIGDDKFDTIESGAADIPNFDCLKEVKAQLPEQYQAGARWIMNRSTYLALDKLTDAVGHYLIQPDVTGATEGTLLGKPITFMYNMPEVGAGLMPVLYGDFNACYIIVDAPGAFVIRDEATDFGRIVFKTERLGVGGGVVDYDAVVVLETET
jgi:HK97 family phage major capsid protein